MIETESEGDCLRILYSQWLVNTTESLVAWNQKMQAVTDKNDLYLIVPISYAESIGRLPNGAWEWLEERS